MTGRDFYANDLVNILMICLHEARVCFNIAEKVCVCASVCVCETEMVHPGGRTCAPASPRLLDWSASLFYRRK